MIIRIHQLQLRTIVGTYSWEQEQPRQITVNLEIECDARQAAALDSIQHTINYHSISQRILQTIESRSYKLIETIADHIIKLVMEDARVRAVQVEVFKPGALQTAASVSVIAREERGK